MARLRAKGAGRRLMKSFLARLATAPATERVAERVTGRLHRAASNLAEVTSEVSAYAGLLEEKAGELHDRTKGRRAP